MKRVLLTALLFSVVVAANSQTTSIDSLQKVLLIQKQDTNKVYILIQLASLLTTQKEYSKSLQYAQQGLTLAEKLHFKRGVAEAYRSMARNFSGQEKFVDMLQYNYKALEIYNELRDKRRIASCLSTIGFGYQMQADFEEALKNLRKSLLIWEEVGAEVEIVRVNNVIGSIYQLSGNYQAALERHLKSLQIAEKLKKPEWMFAMTLARLGGDYEFLADGAAAAGNKKEAEELYAQALQCFIGALKSNEKNKDQMGVAEVYWHFGSLYRKQKKYDLSKEYFEKSLAISKAVKHGLTIVRSYEQLAKIDSAEGNYQSAFNNYCSFIFYRDSIYSSATVRKTEQLKLQFEFSKREDSLKLQHQLTGEKLKQQKLLGIQQQQQLQLQQASLALIHQQNELNYLAFLRSQTQLQAKQSEVRDKEKQLLIVEKERALEQANLKLKTTELGLKEKEVSAKKMERNVFIISAFAVFILGLTLYKNSQHKQRISWLMDKQQMRTQIASDLHDDIGSELTSISFYTETVKMQLQDENQGVKNTMDKIGNNARAIVNAMNDIVWVINPDNDITENLIRRIRNHTSELCNERDIKYYFDTEGETASLSLNMQQRKNLYLIFKEALHNAIKYSGCSSINIKLSQKDHLVQLMIQDNGKGFDLTNAKEGNGLRNMRKRAEEIKAVLDLQACPSRGTSVLLELKIT